MDLSGTNIPCFQVKTVFSEDIAPPDYTEDTQDAPVPCWTLVPKRSLHTLGVPTVRYTSSCTEGRTGRVPEPWGDEYRQLPCSPTPHFPHTHTYAVPPAYPCSHPQIQGAAIPLLPLSVRPHSDIPTQASEPRFFQGCAFGTSPPTPLLSALLCVPPSPAAWHSHLTQCPADSQSSAWGL